MSTHNEQSGKLLVLMADTCGWELLVRLGQSDDHVRGLAAASGHTTETVQDHLAQLRELGLLQERQSDVNTEDTFYRLDLVAMRAAWVAIGMAIHPVVGGAEIPEAEVAPKQPLRVLFLCTGNSARSQMAEGFMRHFSKGQVDVFSAGTKPSQVNPIAIETMARAGVDIRQQRSKHLNEFLDQKFDYVITVCDHQREECPLFPGGPILIHWSFPDPAAVEPGDACEQAFRSVANQLRTLIRHFLILIEKKDSHREISLISNE